MSAATAEPTIASLLGALAKDAGQLVRQEVQLASAEMNLKVKAASRSAAIVGAGAGLSLAGLIGLMLGAIVGLQAVMPLWAACLAVGATVAFVGAALIRAGLASVGKLHPLPQRALRAVKADFGFAKGQLQ